MTRNQMYLAVLKYHFFTLMVDNEREPNCRAMRRNYWREARQRAAHYVFHARSDLTTSIRVW
jgi:hypothetical protein